MAWTKDEILERANRWAKKKGYMLLTEASLMEWKEEKLIPNPQLSGRGRGQGIAKDWSYIAYYRILKIMQMREAGIIHRRDQRLTLWFAGQNIPIEKIRGDIRDKWESMLKNMNYQKKDVLFEPLIEFKKDQIPENVQKILENTFKENKTFEILENNQLDQDTCNLFVEFFKSFAFSSVNPDYQGLENYLNKLVQIIPDIKDVLKEEVPIIIQNLLGLAGSIDSGSEFLNKIATEKKKRNKKEKDQEIQNETISDLALINIKCFIAYLVNIIRSAKILLTKISNKTINQWSSFEYPPFYLLLNDFIPKVQKFDFSLEQKVIIFIFILKRSDVRQNNGLPFHQIGYVLNEIITWLIKTDVKNISNFDDLMNRISDYLVQEKTILLRVEEIKNENSDKS